MCGAFCSVCPGGLIELLPEYKAEILQNLLHQQPSVQRGFHLSDDNVPGYVNMLTNSALIDSYRFCFILWELFKVFLEGKDIFAYYYIR